MFTVRLKHVKKVNNMRNLKNVASCFVQSAFLSCPILVFFFVRHFGAEEIRHICCRICHTPGSPMWPMPVYLNFPPGGRSPQAAVQTLPLASVPYTASSGAGWMVIFLVTGSYDVGRLSMFQCCISSGNYCDGHLGMADWRSWVLIGGT